MKWKNDTLSILSVHEGGLISETFRNSETILTNPSFSGLLHVKPSQLMAKAAQIFHEFDIVSVSWEGQWVQLGFAMLNSSCRSTLNAAHISAVSCKVRQ